VVRKVNATGVVRLPAFSHAAVAGPFIFVSGMIGARPETMELTDGGVAAETRQALENIRAILRECGATFGDVAKMQVYLTDLAEFEVMNEAYLQAFNGEDPPARITVGCDSLALDASVEIDCVAYRG